MKINLMQRQLTFNAAIITKLHYDRIMLKDEARTSQYKVSRTFFYKAARRTGSEIEKLADCQRAIKRDILALKMSRAQVYKKHGKDDPRYTAWLESKQAAERSGDNYAPVQFFAPVESSISCGC